MRLLNYFDKYVSLGLKPIAVYKDSKKPVCASWNENWSKDRWRPYFQDDQYNMGVLLGDIIDVEGDTEEANDLLLRMIDNSSCPKFKSAKSTHYLFLNPDPHLTRKVFNGIEFRGHRHQSVLPPSVHNEGQPYCWLESSKFPVPPMPDGLLEFYRRNSLERPQYVPKPKTKRRQKEGFIWTPCNKCQKKFFMNKIRLMLEVRAYQKLNLRWMCRSCSPQSIKELCREVRQEVRYQNRHKYKE